MTVMRAERVVYGVPNLDECARFFADFGLDPLDGGRAGEGGEGPARFATQTGQVVELRDSGDPSLPPAVQSGPSLREIVWGVDSQESIDKLATGLLADRSIYTDADGTAHTVDETGFGVGLAVSQPVPGRLNFQASNRSGNINRWNEPVRHPGSVKPLRLCHVALDIEKAGQEEAVAFYTGRLGFVPTDRPAKVGVFMRAPGDSDHHTLLLCHRPDKNGINHCAYEVARVDEVIVGVNPATEEVIGRVPFAGPSDVAAAIAAAAAAFPKWRDLGPEGRSKILLKTAALLHQRADEIGRVMVLEEGKALGEATGEVHRAAAGREWNTEEGRRAYGRIIPSGPDEILSVRTVPVGPVGAFVPWNFPAGGPMRKISAALAAGDTIVIKPSEEVPATVSLVARAFADAGLPPGVLNVIFGVPDEISRTVIADPAIRFIAFTGSIPVGKHLAGLAAQVMKPAAMELGGHAPVIVAADADPVAAARSGARVNAGQVCTSPSRFLVHRSIYPRFVEAFTAAMASVKVGPGLHAGVQMGPMVSYRRLAGVQKLIEDAVSRGATVTTGGQPLEGKGFFFPPTVLTDVPADAAILHEEPFGPVAPVAPVAPFDDLDEALELANSLPFGLAAYGYTDSAATAEKLIAGYEAGILSINHCSGSVPSAPSGGFKESGYGREGGPEGLEGYLVTKRVSHKLRP
jgi:succinate-semialdehyde dehydrogenase/glutarate-semialdehyde dehydrogenase